MNKVISSIISIMLLSILSALFEPKTTAAREFSPTGDYSSEIEKQIRSGKTTTAKLLVNYHPRIWLRGAWDLDKNNVGSFAWRIVHGRGWSNTEAANDDLKHEYYYLTVACDTYMYGATSYSTFGRRYLWTILAAGGVARRASWNLPLHLPNTTGTYSPTHTEDELLADARAKLLVYAGEWNEYVGAHTALHGAAGYDWLVNRKYSDGITPVLSASDRATLQATLITVAEKMKASCGGAGTLIGRADHIYKYFYPIIGMALYEPDGVGISAADNAKALGYLNDFDTYWVRKILPALNELGGDGGWSPGLGWYYGEYPAWGYYGSASAKDVLPYRISPLLYAHYTSTGQTFSNSIFDTGILKYAPEFWNYMIYPDGHYVQIGPQNASDNRYVWVSPLLVHARRRFSTDAYDQKVGELAGWVRSAIAPSYYVNAGSYDMFDQLMFKEPFGNARAPVALGFPLTRHFSQLGWVAMRTGFASANDLAALFVSQRYHWCVQDPYAQNSFNIMRKGWLITGTGNNITGNTFTIDGVGQRTINTYPTVAQGVRAYTAVGSAYDVGPGVLDFVSNTTYDYVKGEATKAYDTAKLSKWTRQFIYLKPDIFVIFDNVITTSSGYQKKWNVVPATLPVDQGGGILKIANGAGALWIKKLLPVSATVTFSSSQISVVPNSPGTQDFFLHVMQAVDSNKGAKQVIANDATVVVEADGFLVNVGSYKMRFSKDGGFEFIDGRPKTP